MKIEMGKLYLVCFVLLLSNISFASNNPPQPAVPIPPPSLPLSNEIILLAIAAVILAFYKYKKSFKVS
ncbi:MAG: hypothetical protein RIQ59_2084 [Bacteroidota bacterium]|jgi:hypothetical protein